MIGLGNPGNKYKNNRHNAGQMFVDYLVNSYQLLDVRRKIEFKSDKYLLSQISEILPNNQYPITNNLLLAKPIVFMNKSGLAVKKLVQKYLPNNQYQITNNLIIIHDDLDIPFCKFRIVKGYGPKQHNGIESIENKLQTKDFLRVRIGVDNRSMESRIPGIDYVLQDFDATEKETLIHTFSSIKSLLEAEKYI